MPKLNSRKKNFTRSKTHTTTCNKNITKQEKKAKWNKTYYQKQKFQQPDAIYENIDSNILETNHNNDNSIHSNNIDDDINIENDKSSDIDENIDINNYVSHLTQELYETNNNNKKYNYSLKQSASQYQSLYVQQTKLSKSKDNEINLLTQKLNDAQKENLYLKKQNSLLLNNQQNLELQIEEIKNEYNSNSNYVDDSDFEFDIDNQNSNNEESIINYAYKCFYKISIGLKAPTKNYHDIANIFKSQGATNIQLSSKNGDRISVDRLLKYRLRDLDTLTTAFQLHHTYDNNNSTITLGHDETTSYNQNIQHIVIHWNAFGNYYNNNKNLFNSKNDIISKSISNTIVPSKTAKHFLVHLYAYFF